MASDRSEAGAGDLRLAISRIVMGKSINDAAGNAAIDDLAQLFEAALAEARAERDEWRTQYLESEQIVVEGAYLNEDLVAQNKRLEAERDRARGEAFEEAAQIADAYADGQDKTVRATCIARAIRGHAIRARVAATQQERT